MLNVQLNPSSIAGIGLAAGGAGLYLLRSLRPGLARDHDIFFAAVALLCGGILFFQGWRQDPILQFGQFLLTGSAIFFAVESVRLRNVATEQAKRNTPIVDDERPVSRVYRAELDELEPIDERPMTRRIRGTRDVRSNQTDEYAEDLRRRPPTRSSGDERLGPGDRSRKRRPRSTDRPSESPISSDFSDSNLSGAGSSKPPRSRGGTSRPSSSDASSSRPRTRRPPQGSGASSSSRRNSDSSDYVDYQPIDFSDDETDNSSNFD